MTLTEIRQKMLYSSAMGCFWFVCVNDLVKVSTLQEGKERGGKIQLFAWLLFAVGV